MPGLKWSEGEDRLLKDLWPTASKDEIIKNFNRTYASLIIRASNLGLKKSYEVHPYVRSNLSVLLNETNKSLYWVGFLMADGSILKKRLSLVLAKKDKEHLCKFQDFCEIPNFFETKKGIGVRAQDSFTIPKICSKYSMWENKTCSPTNFIPDKENLFLSFLIGFIDGDGCVKNQTGRKDSLISVKLHKTWLGYLNKLSRRVSNITNVKPTKAKINKKGYAIVNWCNAILIKFLKKKALEFNLPVLNRKWNRIDLNYVSRNETRIENLKELRVLVKKGLKSTEIADKLGVSNAWVSINKRKLK